VTLFLNLKKKRVQYVTLSEGLAARNV
jgi:hypothetical protein